MRPPAGFPADHPLSYVKIEKIARDVRRVLAPTCSITDPLPVLQLFEGLDRYTVAVDGREVKLQYGVEALLPGVEAHARYNPDRDCIDLILNERTYDELDAGGRRPRFTVCHEIGHAVLHATELVRWSSIPHGQASALLRGKTPTHQHYRDTEWQANAFAAALLSPAEGIAELERRYRRLEGVHLGMAPLLEVAFHISAEAAHHRVQTYRTQGRCLLP